MLDARTTLAASGGQDEFVELDASGAPVVGEGEDARRGPRKAPPKKKAPPARKPEAAAETAGGEASE